MRVPIKTVTVELYSGKTETYSVLEGDNVVGNLVITQPTGSPVNAPLSVRYLNITVSHADNVEKVQAEGV